MYDYKARWTSIHAALLRDFCAALNKAHLEYFILRNYEGLPEENSSKDVDFLIKPGQFSLAFAIIKQVFARYNFHWVNEVRYGRVHCCYGMNLVDRLSIHIDLIENFLHCGFELYRFDFLYRKTLPYKNFRVLSPDADITVLLYYKLLMAKTIAEQYRQRIRAAMRSHGPEISNQIMEISGRRYGKKITAAIREDDFRFLEINAKKIKCNFILRKLLQNPIISSWNCLIFCLQQFFKIVICPENIRKFIAVLGPDGVGKSTFIDLLEKKINFYYVADGDKCCIFHHRPGRLPNLGALGERAKVMKEDKDFTNPHRGKPANVFSSLLRMAYYWLDYLLFVPILVRRNAKWDFVTLFDRYIYDFLIDPRRSRIKLPYALRKIFTVLVPQPRLVFVLLTDAETIYDRKPELPKAEISRQLGEYRKLAASSSRFVVLDASQTPEQLANQAMEYILNNFCITI